MICTMRRTALLAIPFVALAATACDDDDDPTQPDLTTTFETSFETGMAGFAVDTDDLDGPPVSWSVERTTDEAEVGSASVAIQVDNVNDKAKVWIEREMLDLEPNTTYAVDIEFAFGSADWGTVNLWTLFADADAESPDSWSDFDDAVRSDTGNGASEDSGVLWDDKTATVVAQTNAQGTLHIAIGVWGTYEVNRTYYLDDLKVTATEVAPV